MRPRNDFYTLCPSCEHRIDLPLAARLQAARSGTMCHCSGCANTWICIQEWVFRDLPVNQPLATPVREAVAFGAATPAAFGTSSASAFRSSAPVPNWAAQPSTVAASQPEFRSQIPPPRPHLPTFQPPQHAVPASSAPSVISQQAAHVQHPASPSPNAPAVPKPHAWSWERTASTQPVAGFDNSSR